MTISHPTKASASLLAAFPFLGVALISIYSEDFIKNYVHLIVLLLFGWDFFTNMLNTTEKRWKYPLLSGTLTAMACTLQYRYWGHTGVWIGGSVLVACLHVLTQKIPRWYTRNEIYFRKSGIILTLFLVSEPTIENIQQNLKPISTIPITQIINTQSLILIGGLLLLTLGGFIKERKSRH